MIAPWLQSSWLLRCDCGHRYCVVVIVAIVTVVIIVIGVGVAAVIVAVIFITSSSPCRCLACHCCHCDHLAIVVVSDRLSHSKKIAKKGLFKLRLVAVVGLVAVKR